MPLLEIDDIHLAFGPTQALAGVSLHLSAGEIVALMGANGAGKSTLVNILSGTLRPDRGTIRLLGNAYAPSSPAEAQRAGIVTVHQSTDRIGIPGLTVADSLLLNEHAAGRRPFFLTRASVRRRAAALLAKAGFSLDLDRDFGDLSAADRQLTAIARAVAADAKLLILDEPTASLSGAESERLYTVLEDLRARGLAILYISHRLADLRRLADRTLVLRGGRLVAEHHRPLDHDKAVADMIGRSLAAARPTLRTGNRPVLELDALRLLPDAPANQLTVHEGEVVAITGPLGSGKSRLLATLFGLAAPSGGSIRLDSEPFVPKSPREALARGVAYAGEDRHRTSLQPAGWPGARLESTISLPHLSGWYPLNLLLGPRERREGISAIARLGIKASGPSAPIETLSGGNQQKLVLARWQAEPQRLLLLDEPFQGVDVGARADIIAAVRNAGTATLIATSDPEEAAEVADRIFAISRHGLTELAPDRAETSA